MTNVKSELNLIDKMRLIAKLKFTLGKITHGVRGGLSEAMWFFKSLLIHFI